MTGGVYRFLEKGWRPSPKKDKMGRKYPKKIICFQKCGPDPLDPPPPPPPAHAHG